jgi:hypothetical protein
MKLINILSITLLLAFASASQATSVVNFDARFSSDNRIDSFEAFDGTTTTTLDLSSLSNLGNWRISDVFETYFDPTKHWTFTFNTTNYTGNVNPEGFIADITFAGNTYNTGSADWLANKDGGAYQDAIMNPYDYSANSSWTDENAFTGGQWIGFDSTINQTGPNEYSYQLSITPVPEASTYALMLSGLGFIGMMVRRRKKTSERSVTLP